MGTARDPEQATVSTRKCRAPWFQVKEYFRACRSSRRSLGISWIDELSLREALRSDPAIAALCAVINDSPLA